MDLKKLILMGAGGALAAACVLVSPLDDLNSSGTGGSGGNAGGDGSAGSASCTTHLECSVRLNDEPARCVSGQCVELKTAECPCVPHVADDGAEATWKDPNSILIGAFSHLRDTPTSELCADVFALNYRTALRELNGKSVGGLPGPGGDARPIALLLCDNQESRANILTTQQKQDLVLTATRHLVDDLGVQGVIAKLDDFDLQAAFGEVGSKKSAFFITPNGATKTLAALPDQNLLWHMLGLPSDLALAYAEVLLLLEPIAPAVLNEPGPLRVILLTNDEAFESELTLGSGTDEGLQTLLHFNGKTLAQNEDDGNFESLTVAPGDTEDKQLAIDRIKTFRPHVVVSAIGPDLNDIWFVADESWRPYYILSPLHSGQLGDLMEYVKASSIENGQPIHERFVGVDIAGSEDQELLKAYRDAIIKAFPNAPATALQAENTYDAVYFLSYAMVAGSKTADPFGLNIAGGMTKIIGGGSTFNVGVAHAPSVMADLLADKNVTLFGALGPPNWDSRGFRRSTGALYCFKEQGTFPLTAEFHVGHLDEVTKKLRLAKQYATLAPPCLQWLNLPAPPP